MYACSGWSKTHGLSEYSINHKKSVVYCFLPHYLYIIKQQSKWRSLSRVLHCDKTLRTYLRTLEKCRKHPPATCVSYNSFMFSNARCVLSQCNAQLRLLDLLNISSLCTVRHYLNTILFYKPTLLNLSMIWCHTFPQVIYTKKKKNYLDIRTLNKNKLFIV